MMLSCTRAWMSGDRDRRRADGDPVVTARQRLVEWFLVDGPRYIVAGTTVVALFAFLTAVSRSRFAPWESTRPLFYIFVGLITGNLTVITVVVSISQLLLSTELKTPDELRSQLNSAIEYRRNVRDAAGRVPPVRPLAFLRLLFETTRRDAQRLREVAIAEADETVAAEIDRVVSAVTARADRVDRHLRGPRTATVEVLSVTLTTNYADEIQRLRQIQSAHGDRIPDRLDETIDGLVRHLEDIDIARQYFKTIYLQEELAVLSRHLFYVGLPAVTIVASGLFAFTASSGASVSRSALTVAVPAIVAIGFVPLAVLFAFILRIATISQRTAAMLPFTTPTQERERSSSPEEIEWGRDR